jgi:dolasta-1(15),8-diene / delta-araneosene synthase
MVSKMMQCEASTNRDVNIDTLMNLLGRYYQTRDDYQDITGTVRSLSLLIYCPLLTFSLKSVGKSANYNDLDQGTFTLPIIHALEFQDDRGITELRSIFQSGKQTNGLSSDLKRLVIKRLEETGSLEYTKGMLDGLHEELKQEIDAVEKRMGSKNWILRLMMLRLRV